MTLESQNKNKINHKAVKAVNEKINSKKSIDIKNNSKQLKLNTKKVA